MTPKLFESTIDIKVFQKLLNCDIMLLISVESFEKISLRSVWFCLSTLQVTPAEKSHFMLSPMTKHI